MSNNDNSQGDSTTDFSDTEQELARMLNTFTKGKETATSTKSNDDSVSMTDVFEGQHVPNELETRLKKASKENIRLISSDMTKYLKSHEFKVRGSTGKTYTVVIGSKLLCTCEDYKRRGGHCKHILYVLFKELKVTEVTSPIYLTVYPTDETLEALFARYHN